MLTAVELDDEAVFQAGEVGDLGIDRDLLTEFEAPELADIESQPELAFCVSHFAAQLLRTLHRSRPVTADGRLHALALAFVGRLGGVTAAVNPTLPPHLGAETATHHFIMCQASRLDVLSR
jgi:hypothetical protein